MKIKTLGKTIGIFIASVAVNVATELYRDYKSSPVGMNEKTLIDYSNYKKAQFDAAMKLDSIMNIMKNTKAENLDSSTINNCIEEFQTAAIELRYTQKDIDKFNKNPELKVKEDIMKKAKEYADAKAEQFARFNNLYNE